MEQNFIKMIDKNIDDIESGADGASFFKAWQEEIRKSDGDTGLYHHSHHNITSSHGDFYFGAVGAAGIGGQGSLRGQLMGASGPHARGAQGLTGHTAGAAAGQSKANLPRDHNGRYMQQVDN